MGLLRCPSQYENGGDDDEDHTVDLLRYSQQNHQNNVSPKAPAVRNNQGVVPLVDRGGGRGRQPGNSLSQDRGGLETDEEVHI